MHNTLPPPGIQESIAITFLITGTGGLCELIAKLVLIFSVLWNIHSTYGIKYAKLSMIILVFYMAYGFFVERSLSAIETPEAAYTRAWSGVFFFCILVLGYYFLYRTFFRVGELFDITERNPGILDDVIQELLKSEQAVKISDFIKGREIAYDLLIKRIKEKTEKGEIDGYVHGDIFYPRKKPY